MRLAKLEIDSQALLHNLATIKNGAKVIAMVKSNAYGCGLEKVCQTLEHQVDAFGVAILAEALAIRQFGLSTPCIIFEGPHQAEELAEGDGQDFAWVLHHEQQVEWVCAQNLSYPLKLWLKVNTGMNRLGFKPEALHAIHQRLNASRAVNQPIGLMTHFACADEVTHPLHHRQKEIWQMLSRNWQGPISACNSAGAWSSQEVRGDYIRPGLMLYGVSPFVDKTAKDLNLRPVMRFSAGIISIYELEPHEFVGYSATYETQVKTKLAIVGIGYGDGYPRHIQPGTVIAIKGKTYPIVGRISMDKLAVDITDSTGVRLGDLVELWGGQILLEYLAKQAGTIPYELMTQVGPRERLLNLYLNRK